MRLQYFGTATLRIEYAGVRLLTDPALDRAGTRYDFGPWYAPRRWFASEKLRDAPVAPDALGDFDAVLLSHDHHADNLDHAGRALIAQGNAAVYTTRAGAVRLAAASPRSEQPGEGLGLGARARGLGWHETARVAGARGELALTATPARHGPVGTPRVHEVNGWRLESAPGGPPEPTVWITGDTVRFDAIDRTLDAWRRAGRRVDVLVVHCGGVRFPSVPLLGRSLFTFDAAQVLALCQRLAPRWVVPVHRDGWTHFREPEARLREALAPLGEACRFLDVGDAVSFPG